MNFAKRYIYVYVYQGKIKTPSDYQQDLLNSNPGKFWPADLNFEMKAAKLCVSFMSCKACSAWLVSAASLADAAFTREQQAAQW